MKGIFDRIWSPCTARVQSEIQYEYKYTVYCKEQEVETWVQYGNIFYLGSWTGSKLICTWEWLVNWCNQQISCPPGNPNEPITFDFTEDCIFGRRFFFFFLSFFLFWHLELSAWWCFDCVGQVMFQYYRKCKLVLMKTFVLLQIFPQFNTADFKDTALQLLLQA